MNSQKPSLRQFPTLTAAIACVAWALSASFSNAHAQVIESRLAAPSSARMSAMDAPIATASAASLPGLSFEARPSGLVANRFQLSARTPLKASVPATLLPEAKTSAPWFAPLASLVVPGAGQAILRQQRSLAYLVAEGFLALRAARTYRDRNSARSDYQRLAADVARAPFGADRPTGPWDYYEILEKNSASGAYDLGTGGKFTPETDETTYNGKVWLEARTIFWADPAQTPAEASNEYQRAVDRYRKEAVQGSFRFSWKDQTNVQNEYILSIADANRSKQQFISTFGVLAVNHLTSLVDAYITVRLRRFGGAGLVGASIKSEVRSVGGYGDNAYGAAMTISLPVPGSGIRW